LAISFERYTDAVTEDMECRVCFQPLGCDNLGHRHPNSSQLIHLAHESCLVKWVVQEGEKGLVQCVGCQSIVQYTFSVLTRRECKRVLYQRCAKSALITHLALTLIAIYQNFSSPSKMSRHLFFSINAELLFRCLDRLGFVEALLTDINENLEDKLEGIAKAFKIAAASIVGIGLGYLNRTAVEYCMTHPDKVAKIFRDSFSAQPSKELFTAKMLLLTFR
jgi:hypothetical protein